ncbi:MAG: energy-coupling factor ABC transporter permease, partial [Nitrososphaerales archaeon]
CMHIPDGFLDIQLSALTYLLAALSLGFAVYWLQKHGVSEARASLLGVLAAAIFAAQMLNWPIPGGTSAHFVGSGLAALLLGPLQAMLVLASVIAVQALVFGDGGLTALGANVFNMAVVGVVAAFLVYKIFERRSRFFSAFLAGWFGAVSAAVACGLEIGSSSIFAYNIAVTVPVMFGWHAVLGVVEGFATSAAVVFIMKRSPHLLAGVAEVKST